MPAALSPLIPDALATGPVLAVDLGASRIRAALVRPDGVLAARETAETRSELGPEAVIADIVALLERVRNGAPKELADALVGVGLAAPGPLDPTTGRFIDTPNLGDAFRGAELAGPVGQAIGLTATLERDTNVALLAECAFGAARGAQHAIYMTVSSGVGGAVLARGQVLAGADGLAGELGHVVVDIDGPPCGCGGRGHLEALSSGTAIARAAAELVAAGRAPGLARVAAASPGGNLTAREVADAEEAGDADAARLMRRARDAVAAAMVGLVNVFNPEVIVVGGSVAQAQGERLLEPARQRVAAEAFKVQSSRVRIVLAALGDDVGLIGALGLVGSRITAARDGRG